jgi:hypothetical protein
VLGFVPTILNISREILEGGVMFKFKVCSIFLILILTNSVGSIALSSTIPNSTETANKLDASTESNIHKYYLVTLPSTNKKRVDSMCIKFLSLIHKAKLIPKTEERTIYRLITDKYVNIESAKRLKAELLKQCETPFVIKNDNGYSVVASSQLTENFALAEQKRLASKNIPTTILVLSLPLKQWQMKTTESFNIRDAVLMASRLAKIGVIATLEPTTY